MTYSLLVTAARRSKIGCRCLHAIGPCYHGAAPSGQSLSINAVRTRSRAVRFHRGKAVQRAYSVFTIKQFDDDERVIRGTATTPTPDRLGDIVEPDGAEFELPLPLLMGHDSTRPIGHVTDAKVTKNGINVTAQLVKVDEPASLKEKLDEAWALLKTKLVRGLSIGFRSIESSRIEDSFSFRFIRWQWLELSAVVIPANAEATIAAVKSIDHVGRCIRDLHGGQRTPPPTHKIVEAAIACLNKHVISGRDAIPPAAIGNGTEDARSPGASGCVNLKTVRNRDGTFRANPKFRG